MDSEGYCLPHQAFLNLSNQDRNIRPVNKTIFIGEIKNKQHTAKPGEVERKWYVVDATDVLLGRLLL